MAAKQSMSYGFESPISDELTSNSEYEDVSTIARIGQAEMQLCGKFQVFHQEILENFYRLAGHIYSAADLRKLGLEKRPNFEWNLFLPIILGLVGNFKGSIPSVDFIGESALEEQGAKLQKKLSDFFLFQANDIEYELAKAYLWSVVGRIGWLKTSWSYRKDPEGMVLVEWYDSLRLKFDTNWRRRDTSDMRYISDAGWYEASEIIDIYAKNNVGLRDEIYDKATLIVGESGMKKGKMRKMMLTWAERFLNSDLEYTGRKHGFDSFNDNLEYNYGGTWYNGDGRFKVVDWYEKRQQPIMKIIDMTTGKEEDITDQVKNEKLDPYTEKNWFDRDKLAGIRARFSQPIIKESWREVIWQTSVVPALNMKLFDAPQKIQSGYFKFIPVLCYDFHPDILETKAVMDNIVDPVSSYNLRRNTILTYIMKMTQGGWIAEQGAVKGFEDELISNEIVGLKKVADGALSGNRIQKMEPPIFPAALADEAQMEKEDTQIISGQSPNVQGRKESAKETGVLYNSRVQQASILQDWISDNAQYSLIITAINNHELARKYLTMPRTITIVGDENDPEWLQLNVKILDQVINDVSFGKYSIKISKQPYGKKAVENEFQKIMAINQWLQTLDPAFVDPNIALKMSGLTVKNEMINHIKGVQQQMMQDAQAKQQADQQQQVEDQKDKQVARQIGMNHSKLDLIKSLNELHKGTLENRNLADQVVTNDIMKKVFNKAS